MPEASKRKAAKVDATGRPLLRGTLVRRGGGDADEETKSGPKRRRPAEKRRWVMPTQVRGSSRSLDPPSVITWAVTESVDRQASSQLSEELALTCLQLTALANCWPLFVACH